MEINFGRYSEIVKRETGEPDWDTYEDYFEEVLEGRSIKSVVKALRNAGYSVSETTVRARFKEWLAYKRAREEFEVRLNQIKGDILSKVRKTQKEIEEDIREEYEKIQNDLISFGALTDERLTKIEKEINKQLKRIENQVNEKLNEIEEETNKRLNEIKERQKAEFRNLKYETELLKKALPKY